MNHVFILFIKLLFLRITLVSAAGRKYDLDEESRTLYGENLTEVLNKFRRTPEYVEILLERNNKLQNRIQSIMSQADHYFQSVLDKEIEVKIRDSVTKNPPRTAAFRSKNRHPLYIHRRQDGDPEPEPDKPGGGGGGGGGAEGPNPEDIDVIAKLDEFFAMTRPMSAVEKNEWRDWAFDQLPRLIDYIVAPLGSEGRQHGGITKAPVDTEPKPAPKPEPEPEPEPVEPPPPEDEGDTKEGGDEGAGGGEPPNDGNKLKESCRDGKTEAKPRIKGHTMPTANPKVKKSKNVIMLY